MPPTYEGFTGGVPASRIRAANHKPINPKASYVLYWMMAARRSSSNFALDRAIAWAVELRLPVVVLEALRVDYRFASDRLHRFVIDGMADNLKSFGGSEILYYPYVETHLHAARGLLQRLAQSAAVVITDDYPCFFLPQAVAAASRRLEIRLEAIDGNGLIPLSAIPREYPAAVHHRRFMQGVLRTHLGSVPVSRPLKSQMPSRLASLPAGVLERWPSASEKLLGGSASDLAALPIDHDATAVEMQGGAIAAERALDSFVRRRLAVYHEHHSHPDDRGTSGLSPYLHFGHISAHEVFERVMRHERWNLGRLAKTASGAREGWWGVAPGAEAFLDQLVVWRELGFNTCAKRPGDYWRFESLPGWAQRTLTEHTSDPRLVTYDYGTFESANTHDPVWNAAQREMVATGWMHNYMRMLWGKKILEWSASPQEALETMTALMNRWALDARDPNSYAGYAWTLGKYDRPWPERPIYGAVRSMSSRSAVRKVRLSRYIAGEKLLF